MTHKVSWSIAEFVSRTAVTTSHTEWWETKEMYSLPVLEAGSLTSARSQGSSRGRSCAPGELGGSSDPPAASGNFHWDPLWGGVAVAGPICAEQHQGRLWREGCVKHCVHGCLCCLCPHRTAGLLQRTARSPQGTAGRREEGQGARHRSSAQRDGPHS